MSHEPSSEQCEAIRHKRRKQLSTVETLISENKLGSQRPPRNAVKNTFSMKYLDPKGSTQQIKYTFVPNSAKNERKSPIKFDLHAKEQNQIETPRALQSPGIRPVSSISYNTVHSTKAPKTLLTAKTGGAASKTFLARKLSAGSLQKEQAVSGKKAS